MLLLLPLLVLPPTVYMSYSKTLVKVLATRDVLDFTFPNLTGAGFGRIYELKSGGGRSRSRI